MKPGLIGLVGMLLFVGACGGGDGSRADGAAGAGGGTAGGQGDGSAGGGGDAGGAGGGAAGSQGDGSAGGGGNAGSGGGGNAGGAGGGTGGGGGNAACASAVDQGACASEGTFCSQGCTDACSFCNTLRCTSGRWQRMEGFPAPCFACGQTRCQVNAEYCSQILPGVPGGTVSHSCVSVPSECRPTPTCDCLGGATAGETGCSESGPGQVTLIFAAP